MRVLPLRVAHRIKPDDDAPSVQSHYRTFFPTTSVSAPVSRIGTQPLRSPSAWVSPFASGRQVPVFLIEACLKVTPPSCRTPIGQSAGISQPLFAGQKSESRFRRRLIRLRHVISGLLSFVSLRPHLTEYCLRLFHNAHHEGSLPSQLVAV